MPVREEPREFNLSYSQLIEITRNLCAAMQRDILDFSVFGIELLNITNLSALCDDLENMRTDIEYEGDAMVATEEKDALAEQVREQIRFMSVRADAAFGIGTAKYESFKFEDVSRIYNSPLLEFGRRIIRYADQYKTDLAAYGVTVASLAIFTGLCNDYEAALYAQEHAVNERRLSAVDRARKANELYRFVTNYCNFGKKLFVKTNSAKYQDYIIYTPGPGSLTPPVNLVYNPSIPQISWNPVTNATSYEVVVKPAGPIEAWTTVYSGKENILIHTDPPGNWTVKIRARNANGFGGWSETLDYVVSIGPMP